MGGRFVAGYEPRLLTLLNHEGIVLSREQLIQQVWGFGFCGQMRTVDVHVAHLRDKLAGSGVEIETVWEWGIDWWNRRYQLDTARALGHSTPGWS